MLLKVEVELFAESQLQKVVVEGFLAHINLLGCVFKSVADDLSFFIRHSIVQLTPQRNFFDDVLNSSFFCSLLLRSLVQVWVVYNVARFLSCGYSVYLLTARVVVRILLLFLVFANSLASLSDWLVLLRVQMLRLRRQNWSRNLFTGRLLLVLLLLMLLLRVLRGLLLLPLRILRLHIRRNRPVLDHQWVVKVYVLRLYVFCLPLQANEDVVAL